MARKNIKKNGIGSWAAWYAPGGSFNYLQLTTRVAQLEAEEQVGEAGEAYAPVGSCP